MSCSSCHCDPCEHTHATCDAASEPLSSALSNFITAIFGSVTKTCVNGQVQWVLPCDLEAGFSNFPRQSGEGVACYFSRYIESQQTGPVGPQGPQGEAGEQGEPSVSVKVFDPANQSIPNNVATALNFTSESFDTNGMHDPAVNNSRLTVTIAGKYIIQGQITFNSSSGGAKRIEIRKNGTTVVASFKERIDAGTDTPELSVIQVHDLEDFIVGDYVELLAFQDSGVAVDVVGQSNFTWFGMTRHADMGETGPAGAAGVAGPAGAVGAAGPAGPSGAAGSFIIIQDQKPQNTEGGTFTSGAWRTRDLNTEVADTGGDATLAVNQITLAAGTYRALIFAPAWGTVGRHQARFENITDASTVITGTSMLTQTSSAVNQSIIQGRFTIASPKAFEVQHRCESTHATNGFGIVSNFTTEIYTTVMLWKE